jgi:hypothetical protein
VELEEPVLPCVELHNKDRCASWLPVSIALAAYSVIECPLHAEALQANRQFLQYEALL